MTRNPSATQQENLTIKNFRCRSTTTTALRQILGQLALWRDLGRGSGSELPLLLACLSSLLRRLEDRGDDASTRRRRRTGDSQVGGWRNPIFSCMFAPEKDHEWKLIHGYRRSSILEPSHALYTINSRNEATAYRTLDPSKSARSWNHGPGTLVPAAPASSLGGRIRE